MRRVESLGLNLSFSDTSNHRVKVADEFRTASMFSHKIRSFLTLQPKVTWSFIGSFCTCQSITPVL